MGQFKLLLVEDRKRPTAAVTAVTKGTAVSVEHHTCWSEVDLSSLTFYDGAMVDGVTTKGRTTKLVHELIKKRIPTVVCTGYPMEEHHQLNVPEDSLIFIEEKPLKDINKIITRLRELSEELGKGNT